MSAPKATERTYASNVDHRTSTPSVYRRNDHFRVLTRPDGKRKVMIRFETYEEAVAFKETLPDRRGRPRETHFPEDGYLRRDLCAYCDGPGGCIDHIEPRFDGGDDDWTNWTSACRSCNSAKGTTPLLLFLARTNGCFEFRCDKDKRERAEESPLEPSELEGPLFDLLAA